MRISNEQRQRIRKYYQKLSDALIGIEEAVGTYNTTIEALQGELEEVSAEMEREMVWQSETSPEWLNTPEGQAFDRWMCEWPAAETPEGLDYLHLPDEAPACPPLYLSEVTP
tara:strand:+ start:216 stop:551 length:336 start_codon:yes stop_codon:yes gene_type:complete